MFNTNFGIAYRPIGLNYLHINCEQLVANVKVVKTVKYVDT